MKSSSEIEPPNEPEIVSNGLISGRLIFDLLCWQRSPSGKQSFPLLSESLPQSLGNSSSLPVACGREVPPSLEKVNMLLKKVDTGRKKFLNLRKNWASTGVGPQIVAARTAAAASMNTGRIF